MKIVISDMLGFEEEHVAWIHEAAGDDTVVFPESDEDLVAELSDAEVFFGYHSPDVFSVAANLKWMQTTSAGLDMMLTPEVREMGLQVTNASGLHAAPVVETAWALTLAVSRYLKHFERPYGRSGRIGWHRSSVREDCLGVWDASDCRRQARSGEAGRGRRVVDAGGVERPVCRGRCGDDCLSGDGGDPRVDRSRAIGVDEADRDHRQHCSWRDH